MLKLGIDIILFLNMLEIFYDKKTKKAKKKEKRKEIKTRQSSVPLCCAVVHNIVHSGKASQER